MIDKTILKSPLRVALEGDYNLKSAQCSGDFGKDFVVHVFQCEECTKIKIEKN